MTIVPSSNRRHNAKPLVYFAIDVSGDSCFDVAADFGGPPNVQEPPKTMVRPLRSSRGVILIVVLKKNTRSHLVKMRLACYDEIFQHAAQVCGRMV